MAFVNTFRMERVYFERLKSMIDILKPYLNTETDEKLKSILENSIDDNGAILLLYRNLGECWAELSDLIKKADEKIDSLNDKADKYHDELNERIDEVNNYIMAIIRGIEARLEAVEQDLATLSRNIILDLERVNDEYSLSYKGDPVDFAQLAEWVEFPDNIIVRGVVNGEETVFHLREFDTDTTAGVFEFFATGLIDNVVHEITVTVLPDDSVNVATDIQTIPEYRAGTGISISNWTINCTVPDLSNEVADLDHRLDNAEDDIDTLEQTAENLELNKQNKLTSGSGISIDPDTGVIENTAQGVVYTSGKGIGITNDIITNRGLYPRFTSEGSFVSALSFSNLYVYPTDKTGNLRISRHGSWNSVNLKTGALDCRLIFKGAITPAISFTGNMFVPLTIRLLVQTNISQLIVTKEFNTVIYGENGNFYNKEGSDKTEHNIIDLSGLMGVSGTLTGNVDIIVEGYIINNTDLQDPKAYFATNYFNAITARLYRVSVSD